MNCKRTWFLVSGVCLAICCGVATAQDSLKLAVAGASHGHVHGLLRTLPRADLELVGIWEPDRELGRAVVQRYSLSPSLLYTDLDRMLREVRPEAVAAFNPIAEHIDVIEACARHRVDVMVEKPLAVSTGQAERIARLAEESGIQVLTNYETTWYPSLEKLGQVVREDRRLGALRKIVVRMGHEGPREIGVGPEFLRWLTDPDLNGGGALIDFGCYGANIALWLMQGEMPTSVIAVTQTLKPEVYPRVDDEATILLTYPGVQAILQGSWNWPFNRKDLDVYGVSGTLRLVDPSHLYFRPGREPELDLSPELSREREDPFAYLAAVVRGERQVRSHDLSALELNVKVVRILDAARRSAATGWRVEF